MALRNYIVTMLIALGLPCAMFASIPDKPVPPRLVNDFASVFPEHQRDSLEEVLTDFDESTSNQICVVTVRSLDGMDVAQYALQLANKWGVGSSRNNGVVILLMPRGEEGYVDVTIQTGRGVEGAVPDVYASRIIRNIMGPYLREDRYFPAVSEACNELQLLMKGEISEPRDGSGEGEWGGIIGIVLVILVIVFFIYICRVSGKGGGGSSNGGGYTGGGHHNPFIGGGTFGGGSFGGGSTGGFRGFGGGSFGGGGASGRF